LDVSGSGDVVERSLARINGLGEGQTVLTREFTMSTYDTTITATFQPSLGGRSFEIRLDADESIAPQFVGPDTFWPNSPSSFRTEQVTYLPNIKGGPDTDIDPSNGNLNAVSITVQSRGTGTRRLRLNAAGAVKGALLHLADGANISLVLDGNLELVGRATDNTAALIDVGRNNWAELRGSGVTLRDNGNEGNHNNGWGIGSGGLWVFGYVVMKGGELSNLSGRYCGGVVVDGQGTFLMDGGRVINTKTTNPNTNSQGGGVALYAGFFIMREGEISGNTNIGGSNMQFSLFTGSGGVVDGIAVWPSYTHGLVYENGLTGGITYEMEGPAAMATGTTVNFAQNANTVIKAERSTALIGQGL
jgi:hypothetical protein